MQTIRPFAYQRPSQAEALLESLLQERGRLPGKARNVADDSAERCTIGHSQCPYQRGLIVEWLLQRFVLDTCYVPLTAQRLLAPSDLPPALERVAMQAQRCLQTWFAWTDEPRTWFVVAEMATVPDRHCQDRAIRMYFYDEDGRFVSWGTWAFQSERRWILCAR